MLRRRDLIRLAALIAVLLTPLSGPASPALSTTPVRLQTSECALPPPQTLIGNILASLEWDVVSDRTIENVHGEPYQLVDLGVSGRLQGCTTLDSRSSAGNAGHLTDVPELMVPQFEEPLRLPLTAEAAGTVSLVKATGTFQAQDGSGMHVLYPESRSAWNGKVFVYQGGGPPYPQLRELTPRELGSDFDPGMSRNEYVGLMIDRGYAVVWVRGGGGGQFNRVNLEDGSPVNRTYYHVATLELALTAFAKRFLAERLGEPPRLTYFHGFAHGGRTGRLMNYMPGANRDPAGGRIVDGFLLDDASGALPVLFAGGRDILFASESKRSDFVPQIDVTHAVNLNSDNLMIARENARLLLAKELGDKHRAYELRGVSHFDAGRPTGRPESLDLGGVMEAMIDILDEWVDDGIVPPSSRSDASDAAVGPGIALPELACPVGVHYGFPADAANRLQASFTTTFGPFDGAGLEPLDWHDHLVDMNGNGVRDERESMEAAWQRLGLLGTQEPLTPGRYIACVEEAAVALAEERLLPWRVVRHYQSEAALLGARP